MKKKSNFTDIIDSCGSLDVIFMIDFAVSFISVICFSAPLMTNFLEKM